MATIDNNIFLPFLCRFKMHRCHISNLSNTINHLIYAFPYVCSSNVTCRFSKTTLSLCQFKGFRVPGTFIHGLIYLLLIPACMNHSQHPKSPFTNMYWQHKRHQLAIIATLQPPQCIIMMTSPYNVRCNLVIQILHLFAHTL